MSSNPFFSGRGQKQRSGSSVCLPPADNQCLSRTLTRSCDFRDARPGPLRIVKRGERTQSLDMLREDSENTIKGSYRDISPTEDYHRALLSVTKHRSGMNSTTRNSSGYAKSSSEESQSKIRVKLQQLNIPQFQSAHSNKRVFSTDTMSSTTSSAWNSFVAAGVSTRVSSLEEHVDDSKPYDDNHETGPQRRGSSNKTVSLQNVLPHVLSPHVSITTDTAGCYDGRRCIWAAIEISGKLSHTYSAETIVSANSQWTSDKESMIDHQLDRFFKHGCLYDLSVEVQAVPGTKILQILQEHSFPTAVYSGSSVFLLAQVQFDAEVANLIKKREKQRQKSDELIADLEAQLGDAQVAYMQVCLSYRHSAFPEYSGPEVLAGISYLQSQMKTTATASLKRNNASSRWSPRPASGLDCLRETVLRHWGADKVTPIMRQIALTQPSNKKLVKSQSKPILRRPHNLAVGNQRKRQLSAESQFVARPQPVALRKEGERKTSARLIAPSFMSQRRKSSTGEPRSFAHNDSEHASMNKKKTYRAEILRSLTPSLVGIYSSPTEETSADVNGAKDPKDSSFWGWASWF